MPEGKLIVRRVAEHNPFEAWRQLVFRFDPGSTERETVDLQDILNTKPAGSVKEVQVKLAEWEDKQRMYIKRQGC